MTSPRHETRRSPGRWALASLLALAAGCGPDAAVDDPAAVGGLTMLDVMIQIQLATDAIEPDLRNVQALEETSRTAQTIVDWSDPVYFEAFTEDPRFFGDRERFLEMRAFMHEAASDVVAGADGEDLTLLRDGFIRLRQSCIMCHKRYSPSY